MHSAPKRRERGLTLIELLMTVAIAVIVMTLAVPGFNELIARNRMVTAVNTLVANLQLARSEAVTRGISVTLCPDDTGTGELDCADGADPNNWHTGYVVFTDPDRDGNVDAGEEVLRHVQGNAEARIIVTTTSGRPRVTFDQEGASGGFNATFTFCDTGETADARAVVLSEVGRPRIADTNACGD